MSPADWDAEFARINACCRWGKSWLGVRLFEDAMRRYRRWLGVIYR